MDIRRTVLLADVNEEFRLMLREAIEKSGEFTVAATPGDGADLLHLAQQHRPDLVVMDVVLPTVDGLSVMKQLKELGDKLSAEDKATVENELAEFKKVRETNDAEQIKNAMEAFTQKVYAVFGKIYQQQGAGDPNAQANGAQNADNASSDGASDADYDVH